MINFSENQKKALEFLKNNNKGALFLPMGFGKTLTILEHLRYLKEDRKENLKILVLSSLKIVENVWQQEIIKFKMPFSSIVATGNKKNKLKSLNANAEIIISNVEMLLNCYQMLNKYNCIIFDESTLFKNPKSKRFKNLLKGINKEKLKYVYILSGTPIPNNYRDLWAQYFLVDYGERLGTTNSNFLNKFFDKHMYNNFSTYEIKNGAVEIINSLIESITFVADAEKIPHEFKNIELEFNEEDFKKYKTLELRKIIDLGFGNVQITEQAITNLLKLRQVTSGFYYYIDEIGKNQEVKYINSYKIDRLRKFLKTCDKHQENVLLFYNFKAEKEILEKALNFYELKTKEDFKKWNSRKLKRAMLNPSSGGHGLNLQGGGRCIVWFSLNYSSEIFQQANARLLRQGQSKKVIIVSLVVKNTIDEVLQDTLINKKKLQEKLLHYLKKQG